MAAQEGVVNHVLIPEGLNRDGSLSTYYEGCLQLLVAHARAGDRVYLAPGNHFGHPRMEEAVAADRLRQLRPDLVIHLPEIPRTRYFDTLDNAIELRRWAQQQNLWPIASCVLYCNRYHLLRAKLCFHLAGFRPQQILTAKPQPHPGHIVPRLWYYDHAAANVCYEALAIGYTALRLAGAP